LYGGDGQLRVWHIGAHHEYEPDVSSWQRVIQWLEAGVNDKEKSRWASPGTMVKLYADFVVCPVEPFRQGGVQKAVIESATHRHYTHYQGD
jgi:hypothetical protein